MLKVNDNISYDPKSGDFLFVRSAGCRSAGDKAGTVSLVSNKNKPVKYLKLHIDGKGKFAHRVAMELYGHDLTGLVVDHINGNTLDNRIENLRCVSISENNKNLSFNKRSKTGINGVYIRYGRFYSRVTVNRKHINLGVFDNIFDAACARISALNRYGFHRNHGQIR